jgi:hypothetical protein
MILGAIRTLLLEDSVITDIVGTRIFPYALPLGEVIPAIDLRTVSSQTYGFMGGTTGLHQALVVCDCYSKSPREADLIAAQIIKPNNGIIAYQGTKADVYVRDIQVDEGITQDFDGVDPGSSEYRHVSSVSLDVMWSQACHPNN